jgi:DNA-directed RNA polymerase subunit RPC12/RpoP
MKRYFCSICKSKLDEIANRTHRGNWFWCPGCGSIFREVDAKPLEHPAAALFVASPGLVAAFRLMGKPEPPTAPPTTPEANP